MKTRILSILILITGLSGTVSAQHDQVVKIFNRNEPMAWLGLDFSKARIMVEYGKLGTPEDMKTFVKSENDLMNKERPKFDVVKMTNKSKMTYNLKVTTDHNANLDFNALVADSVGEHNHLTRSDINGIVSEYDYEGNSGQGMMFIVETFNKKKQEALIWVVFIDMDAKTVIEAHKMSAIPTGFGLRNFWAGAVYALMKQVRVSSFDRWRDQSLKGKTED